MKVVGNILWIVFGGFLTCIEYMLAGVALCITIIGIPFGLQCFKLAFFVLLPFEYRVEKVQTEDGVGCVFTLMNIIWFFVGAIPLVLTHFFLGLFFAITIVGLPFAKQHFKLMKMSFAPFGREIVADY